MARFLVKASEFKNVCKAVNDRKLAELKKEIIEILKKQDEKEVKKAIDYFESQELHYSHLEKSFNGKWVEKAGYGIGTVRVWKGKKYKKIAPGKWARVFEKEGRGTNIAIGKLIAKVQKIDNVEDLMAFVMANKQRFVDENGVDLPVLDKLRAAVDARNGSVGSKGTSKPAEKKEELSWKDKVLMATDEGAKKELGRGKMYKKHITDIQRIANSNINDIPEKLKTLNDFIEYQDSLSNPDYKQAGKDYARLKNHELAREIWKKVEDGEAEWDDNGYLKLNEHGLLAKPEKKSPEKLLKEMGFERMEKVSFNGDKWEVAGVNLDYNGNANGISLTPDRQAGNLHSSNVTVFDIDKIQKNKPAEKENPVRLKHIVSPIEFTDNHGNKIRYEIDEVKDAPEDYQNPVRVYKVEGNVRTEIAGNVKNYEDAYSAVMEQVEKTKEGTTETEKKYIDESIKTLPKEDSKGNKIEESEAEKTKNEESNSEDIKRAKEKIKQYAGKKINSNEISDIKILDDGRRSGFLTFEFKSGNDKYKMTYDSGFGGEKGGVSIKKIESEESEVEKTQNRSDAMKGNKNAYKGKAEEIANKKLLSKEEMLKKPISKIYQYANADVYGMENFKTIDEALEDSFETYKGSIELGELTEDVLAERVGKEWAKKQNHDIAREIIKDEKEGKLVVNDDGIFVSKKEPEMNNPESLKGIDFVNKNKMHVLANFLANHDKVNMATAVVRLQNAYERLGEEKFLAHFPKDVVERYRKEAGKEETKKESFTPISKDKMKSMSDDELKDYEAKLEKDLLATSRTDPYYVEKYNHWREVHGENNDRFHQAIEDEARAEKQAEADAKFAKDKEINEKYNGYFENRKGLDKARDLKTLEKKYNFDGKVMSSKEFVEQAMDNGVEIKEREVNKLDYPSRTRWNRMNGYEQDEYEKRIKAAGKKTIYSIDGYEFPKTVVDYAKFYKEKKGNVKKSAFDDFVMDMFIDEDEEIEDAIKTDESLFNDYSAEQPELFNSTELMVREAFNRCRVL